jgi:peptidyl-prolyl cis-trans isomerase A (cyclophilin A)
MLRRTLIALAALVAFPAFAQEPAAPPAPEAKPNPRVKLETALGDIVLELYADKAPITTRNYLRYVDRGLFNGATFYRSSRPENYEGTDYGVIQGGLQNDPKKLLAPIAHEPTTKTGLKHMDGTISMGRRAPGTATADWFITLGEQEYLDADPKDPKNAGFAAFGRVVEGMDVVRKILVQPRDPNKGEGVMKGEILKAPVKITRASRVTG